MIPSPAKNSSLEYKMIGGIVKKYPEISRIMERYFGQNCLKKPGFKIQTLKMACLLFGVDQDRLVRDIREVQYLGANKK